MVPSGLAEPGVVDFYRIRVVCLEKRRGVLTANSAAEGEGS